MASTASRPTGRRVQRTRRVLQEALAKLLQERSWDEIGVQDICERADIGRSTFYMHYQGKEQLLASGLDGLRAVLREHAGATDRRKAQRFLFVHGLIDHVNEQRKLFRSVIGRKSSYVVQLRFREMVRQLVAEELEHISATAWHREAAVHYMTGALVELLAWWMDASNAIPPDEIERYFQRLTLAVVAELKGLGNDDPSLKVR